AGGSADASVDRYAARIQRRVSTWSVFRRQQTRLGYVAGEGANRSFGPTIHRARRSADAAAIPRGGEQGAGRISKTADGERGATDCEASKSVSARVQILVIAFGLGALACTLAWRS